MRVAVCLSGQLRNWRLGWSNQKWFFNNQQGINGNKFSVDYFAHTWNISQDRPKLSETYSERVVDREEFDEFVKSFEIKKALYDSKPITEFQHSEHWGALFYSFANSIMLKREYELENNFTYDLVIKSRPDIVFNPSMYVNPMTYDDGTLYSTHGGLMPSEFNMMNFNDCLFLANSRTMDKLINLFHYRMYKINIEVDNVHPMGPGVLMNEYFRDFGIFSKVGNLGFKETLLKEGCPRDVDMFNAEDFKRIDKYFMNWYR